MGLQGPPNHPRVKGFEAEVGGRVHAAGAARLFLDGAREFLRAEKGS